MPLPWWKRPLRTLKDFQPCVDSLLPWFCSSKKFFYLVRMLIHWCWDFRWLTFVALIADQPFPLWDLEIQSILIPDCLIFKTVCAYLSATAKESNVVRAGRFRTSCPEDFISVNINDDFIGYSCTIVFVRVPLAVRIRPKLIPVTMNTVNGAKIYSLRIKRTKFDLLCFQALKSWCDLFDCISAKLFTEPPSSWHDMLGLVQLEPTQCHHEVTEYNVLSFVVFYVCNNGNNCLWSNAKVRSETLQSCTFCLLAPKPTNLSQNDMTDLTFIAASSFLHFNSIFLKAVMTSASGGTEV